MNNKQLAKELLKVTRYGYLENQLEALEKLLNEHRPEQLHKPDVMPSLPRFADLIYEEVAGQ